MTVYQEKKGIPHLKESSQVFEQNAPQDFRNHEQEGAPEEDSPPVPGGGSALRP